MTMLKGLSLTAWASSTSSSTSSYIFFRTSRFLALSPRPFKLAISTMTHSDVPSIPLYAYGVTELYSLIVATAAKRLGLVPTFTHLASTSFHVDGRYLW